MSGWLPIETDPWPDAEPDFELAILSGEPTDVPDMPAPPGIVIRTLDPDEWRTWSNVLLAAMSTEAEQPEGWVDMVPYLMATPNVHVLVAEDGGTAVGGGTLHIHKRVGLMRGGMVIPSARGRGIQRALIAARTRLAESLGCDVMTSQAPPGGPSERNLAQMGLERLWTRPVYRYDPPTATSTDPA